MAVGRSLDLQPLERLTTRTCTFTSPPPAVVTTLLCWRAGKVAGWATATSPRKLVRAASSPTKVPRWPQAAAKCNAHLWAHFGPAVAPHSRTLSILRTWKLCGFVRHFGDELNVITFCTSLFCAGVEPRGGGQGAWLDATSLSDTHPLEIRAACGCARPRAGTTVSNRHPICMYSPICRKSRRNGRASRCGNRHRKLGAHHYFDEGRLLHLVSRLPHGQLLSRWRRQFGLPAPEVDLG